jgi:hypothetical protein
MASLIRYLPGLIAAIVAFAALQFAVFLGATQSGWQILVFFVVYIIVAVAADRAMIAYGTPAR